MKILKPFKASLDTTLIVKGAKDDDESLVIKGMASTDSVDRAHDIVLPSAWSKGGLDNFKKNPILLLNHDYNKPIGRATEIKVVENGLELTGVISKAAGRAYDLVKEGILKAFSVSFMVKDWDYNEEQDAWVVKEAELLETSIVAVPCNQDCVFDLSKSFDSTSEFEKFKQQYKAVQEGSETLKQENSSNSVPQPGESKKDSMEINMTPEELDKKIAEAVEKGATAAVERLEKQKADLEAAEKAKQAKEAEEAKRYEQVFNTGAEKLLKDIEDRFAKEKEDMGTVIESLKNEINEKSEEILKMRESKRHFGDRQNADWKKAFEQDVLDAGILGLATGKGYNTRYAKEVMEKVNAHAGVQVSSADFEQLVSTNVERDIQNALILAPLFREITMQSATQIIPIMPDAGYAEFTANQTASGTNPNGNLDERGVAYGTNGGITMQERTLSTKKLISRSWLGNETEEDAILPILPLIREAMVRSHARGVENAILVGNHADGVYGTGGASFDGLISIAHADGNKTQDANGGGALDVLTAAKLRDARKAMGKYGIRPEDVVYLVNQTGYYELLEDAEFQDMNLVGNQASKLKGSVGQVYGSQVIMCDEFKAPAVGVYHAAAVNVRNYLVPRLRGLTIESDYEVSEQRRVLVASQRLGFLDLIDGATSIHALQHKASTV